jgi:hypothetical protein
MSALARTHHADELDIKSSAKRSKSEGLRFRGRRDGQRCR